MKGRVPLLLGVVLGMALILSAGMGFCVPPGFDDKEIRIASWGPLTGPAAPWGAVSRGPAVLAAMVNEQGGISGRKIRHIVRDDMYNPAQTKVVVKELVEKEGIFAFVSGPSSAGGLAVKDYLAQNKIIWVGPATSVKEYVFPPQPYLFSVYPLYEDEGSVLAKYVVEKLGIKEIGVVYQNDTYGRNGLDGVRQRLNHLKMKPVVEIPVEATEKDLSSHVLKLKSAGAKAVLMWVNPTTGVVLLKTAATVGYKPQWVSSNTLSDFALMNKISGGLWEGVITGAFMLPPDSDDPRVVKYREAAKKYAPEERFGVFFMAGMMFAEPLIEAFKRVGKNLSTDAVLKALNSMKGFQGVGPKLTWSPHQHQGSDSIQIWKCGPGGKTILIQDWTVNDLAHWKK
ncbi:MAG TPA: ABC transporter substrate-binding protein [Syntrophales bacterium]|nr:ABC transporter substrate-binding protein [Syntrophales bacterium]HOL60073.1 ABC transporter substrate-binding protein [Syntrophales bacterium]HPO36183.1 ABC transporter substrate-binding protein [Syntrophales bacterium]